MRHFPSAAEPLPHRDADAVPEPSQRQWAPPQDIQPLITCRRPRHRLALLDRTIGDECLIGIQAVVLNGAKIGPRCIVGAGALVTEGKEFPEGSLIVGSPAKVVRELSAAQFAMLSRLAGHYVEQTQRHRGGIKRIG